MKPLLTIGIASYNYESFLKKGLDAIKNQSFRDYEVLISDDCSTDNSVAFIKEYMSANPEMNIRLIESEKNEGLIANKNKLIQNCRGEYLMLCDADDWMADNCLEKIAQKIKDEAPDRVIVEVAHVDKDGKTIQVEHIPSHQSKWGWNMHHGCADRVSVLRDNSVSIQGYPDDVYFTIEFSKYCRKISIIHEVLYFWLIHLDSAGRKKDIDKMKAENQIIGCLQYIGSAIRFIEERNDSQMKTDREELRLVLLKIYYCRLFFTIQKYRYKEKIHCYHVLRKVMWEIDSDYLNNPCLKKNKEMPLRKYAMQAIRLGTMVEKLHLMPLVLLAQCVIGKFKYFDQ